MGHSDQECRTSRYADRHLLPKPRQGNINIAAKYCNYCKKTGRIRNKCWTLNGCSGTASERSMKTHDGKTRKQGTAENRQ